MGLGFMEIELFALLTLLEDDGGKIVGFKIKPFQSEKMRLLVANFYSKFLENHKRGMFRYSALNGILTIDASQTLGKIFTLSITSGQELAINRLIDESENYPLKSFIACQVKDMVGEESIILLSLPNAKRIYKNLPEYLETIKEV